MEDLPLSQYLFKVYPIHPYYSFPRALLAYTYVHVLSDFLLWGCSNQKKYARKVHCPCNCIELIKEMQKNVEALCNMKWVLLTKIEPKHFILMLGSHLSDIHRFYWLQRLLLKMLEESRDEENLTVSPGHSAELRRLWKVCSCLSSFYANSL